MVTGIEGAAGDGRQVVAGGENVADVETAVLGADLTARQPADFAVGPVGAEPGVDVAELLGDLVEDRGPDERRPNIDADRRSHDGFDPAQRPFLGDDHRTPAWSRAAWSDCA